MPASPPVILTIAGSDCSAGAGLQADLKAVAAAGGYGVCTVTALVSEVPGKVERVEMVSADLVESQLRIIADHYPLAAVKLGMLGTPRTAEIVADFICGLGREAIPNLVIDPVMVASSGDSLAEEETIAVYRDTLLPRATVATPNLAEACVLLGPEIHSQDLASPAAMEAAVRQLHAGFGCSFLLKGGHLADDQPAIDILFDGESIRRFSAPRIPGIDAHGTGCTLSSSIATHLALGKSLADAVDHAKHYVSAAIRDAFDWPTPAGIQALNHFPKALE